MVFKYLLNDRSKTNRKCRTSVDSEKVFFCFSVEGKSYQRTIPMEELKESFKRALDKVRGHA